MNDSLGFVGNSRVLNSRSTPVQPGSMTVTRALFQSEPSKPTSADRRSEKSIPTTSATPVMGCNSATWLNGRAWVRLYLVRWTA